MIIDAQTMLWDTVALSSNAASTNTYDAGAAGKDLTIGEQLVAVIQVESAADATTGNETYEFQVRQDTATNLTTEHDVIASRTIAPGALTVGSIHYIPVPPGSQTKRYLGLYFSGGGTTPLITVTAWFATATSLQAYKAYPDAFAIS